MNKFIAFAFVALLVLPGLAGCAFGVQPQMDENGVGVAVVPLTTLGRTQAGEAAVQEVLEGLADGQMSLAEQVEFLANKLGEAEAANKAAAVAAKTAADGVEKRLADAVLKAKDDAQIDWTSVILAALGVGGLGAGGVAGGLKYRQALLNKPAPGQNVA